MEKASLQPPAVRLGQQKSGVAFDDSDSRLLMVLRRGKEDLRTVCHVGRRCDCKGVVELRLSNSPALARNH